MGVSIRVNAGAVAGKRAAFQRVRPALHAQMLADCNEHVPVDTGALRRSGQVAADGLRWNAPYAKAVYYTGTSPLWCEKAKRENARRWAALVKGQLEGK